MTPYNLTSSPHCAGHAARRGTSSRHYRHSLAGSRRGLDCATGCQARPSQWAQRGARQNRGCPASARQWWVAEGQPRRACAADDAHDRQRSAQPAHQRTLGAQDGRLGGQRQRRRRIRRQWRLERGQMNEGGKKKPSVIDATDDADHAQLPVTHEKTGDETVHTMDVNSRSELIATGRAMKRNARRDDGWTVLL